MRGIGSDGLSFDFVAPVAINYGGWFVLSLSFSSDILCYFFCPVTCVPLSASLCTGSQTGSVLACKFQFLLSGNKGRKKTKKIFNFSIEGHYHEIITGSA
jgi:hypothetical protein